MAGSQRTGLKCACVVQFILSGRERFDDILRVRQEELLLADFSQYSDLSRSLLCHRVCFFVDIETGRIFIFLEKDQQSSTARHGKEGSHFYFEVEVEVLPPFSWYCFFPWFGRS